MNAYKYKYRFPFRSATNNAKQKTTTKNKQRNPPNKKTTCGHVGTRMLPHTGACPGSASFTTTYCCVPKHCTPAARVAQSNNVLSNANCLSTWSASGLLDLASLYEVQGLLNTAADALVATFKI